MPLQTDNGLLLQRGPIEVGCSIVETRLVLVLLVACKGLRSLDVLGLLDGRFAQGTWLGVNVY